MMVLLYLLLIIGGIAWFISGVLMLRTHTLLGKPRSKLNNKRSK